MPRWILPIAVVSGVLVVASSVAMLLGGSDPELVDARTPDQALEGYRIPEFTLVDQRGEPVDESIFEGEITVLDFIFTSCPFICPGMNQRMKMLHDDLKGTGVRFVSITLDPERDTPERLRQYAQSLPADPGRWRFLTGERERTWAIGRSLGFDVSLDEGTPIELAGGEIMANINHPSKLILIGPDRQVLGLYSWAHEADMAALEDRARLLARHLPG